MKPKMHSPLAEENILAPDTLRHKKKEQLRLIHLHNAVYQGILPLTQHYQKLQNTGKEQRSHPIDGEGIVIDDEFNIFISDFKKSELNGLSFLKFSNGIILCSHWKQGQMNGNQLMKCGNLLVYLTAYKNDPSQWEKQIVVYNIDTDLSYLLKIQPRGKEQDIEMPKVTILKRVLTKEQFSPNSAFGFNFQTYLFSPQNFLNYWMQTDHQIQPQELLNRENCFYFGFCKVDQAYIQSSARSGRSEEPKTYVGVVMNMHSLKTLSAGCYNARIELNGCGQFNNKGTLTQGVFKDDFLIKEQMPKNKGDHQSIIKEQHLKAHNYTNGMAHFSSLTKIVKFLKFIHFYLQLFQKERDKYHQVKSSISSSANSNHKYQSKYPYNEKEVSHINEQNLQSEVNRFINRVPTPNKRKFELTPIKVKFDLEKGIKRPGFIFRRMNNTPVEQSRGLSPKAEEKEFVKKAQIRVPKLKISTNEDQNETVRKFPEKTYSAHERFLQQFRK